MSRIYMIIVSRVEQKCSNVYVPRRILKISQRIRDRCSIAIDLLSFNKIRHSFAAEHFSDFLRQG